MYIVYYVCIVYYILCIVLSKCLSDRLSDEIIKYSSNKAKMMLDSIYSSLVH